MISFHLHYVKILSKDDRAQEVKSLCTETGLKFLFNLQVIDGIIDIIGANEVKVYCSGIQQGAVDQFLSKQNVAVWTNNERYSWFAVGMKENILI